MTTSTIPIAQAVDDLVKEKEVANIVINSIVPTSPEKIELLEQLGMSRGLAEALAGAAEVTARRYWIVDNSGSMTTPDGNKIVNRENLVQCSRWAELGDCLRWHGTVAATLGAHTEFRMLNQTPIMRKQTIIVGAEGTDHNSEFDELEAVLKTDPRGMTPLCSALLKVVEELTELKPALLAVGRQASVIIASDGEASDGDRDAVEMILNHLTKLPCDVTIRLCTSEKSVVDYWNKIDDDLELDMDVLDDICNEGIEIRSLNPWIGYGEAMQRVREFGYAPKVFDFIDEKELVLTEAVELVRHIIGRKATSFPDPQLDSDAYYQTIKTAFAEMEPIYDASQHKVVPWVDVELFRKKILKKGQSSTCNLM